MAQTLYIPGPDLPLLYLGYGDRDVFAAGNRLLAEILPKQRVFITAGQYDWPTWKRLWDQFLVMHGSPLLRLPEDQAQGENNGVHSPRARSQLHRCQ